MRGPKGWTWNNVVREATRGRSGAYAIRERASRRVVYVGESAEGGRVAGKFPLRWWKTITRHFQDPSGKFKSMGEWTGKNVFTSRHPDRYEIQVWVTAPGDATMRKQAELIRRLKPRDNKDDGRAYDDSFDFGANVRANPAPYPAGSRAELVHRVYEEARAMGLEPNRDIAPAYDASVGRWVVTDRLGQQHHVRVHFSAERAKRHGMVLANPGAPPATKRERALAAREYREKHWGEEPKGVARELDVVDVGHGVLVELGVLERVEYCTTKSGDPKGATYYHDFGGRLPVLAYHSCERAGCPDVGKLVIAGGSYKVRKHGIVG